MSEEEAMSPIEAARQVVARHDAQAKEANFERCGCEDCKVLRPITRMIPAGAHPSRVAIEELVSAAKVFSVECAMGDAARVADASKRVIAAVSAVDFGMPVSPDRVGGGCWFQKEVGESYVAGVAPVKKYGSVGGRLLAWSTYHDEFESGPGNFPAAVVEELETGQVRVVFAGSVSFSTHPPKG